MCILRREKEFGSLWQGTNCLQTVTGDPFLGKCATPTQEIAINALMISDFYIKINNLDKVKGKTL